MATGAEQNTFFGDALKTAVRLVRLHARELLILFAVQTVLYGVLESLPRFLGFELPSFLLLTPHVFISTFFLGAIVHIMLWDYRPDLPEAFSIAGRAYVLLLIVSVITEFAISAGFFMLLIPGILAAIVTVQAPAIVMAERPGIKETFQESVTRSIDFLFPIFGVCVIAALALFPVFIIIMIVLSILELVVGNTAQTILSAAMIGAATTLYSGVVAVAIYLVLRNRGNKLSWDGGGEVVDGPGRLH